MAFLVPQGPQGGRQGVTGGHGGGGEALGGCHLPSQQLLLAAGQGPEPQGQGHSEVVPGEYGWPTFGLSHRCWTPHRWTTGSGAFLE